MAAVHAIECLAVWSPDANRVFADLLERYVRDAVSHAVPGAEERVRKLIEKRRELLNEQLETVGDEVRPGELFDVRVCVKQADHEREYAEREGRGG